MNLRPINIIAYTPCFYKSFFAKSTGGRRKLPRATKRQKKYYRQAEKRARRWQQGKSGKRMEELFREIEAKDPEMKKLAFC